MEAAARALLEDAGNRLEGSLGSHGNSYLAEARLDSKDEIMADIRKPAPTV